MSLPCTKGMHRYASVILDADTRRVLYIAKDRSREAIHLEITRIADEAKVQPCRISFMTALRYIVDEWLWSSSSRAPGAIPGELKAMRQNIRRFVLPPRRSERRYPREVRMTKTHYLITKKNAAQA